MVTTNELQRHLSDYLQVERIHDYCPNGLQIEASHTIGKIVTGVTACQKLIDEANARDADAVLVHHGYFWKGENPCLIGMKAKRIASLFANSMSLLAYHLPLDVHPVVGNNVTFGEALGFRASGYFANRHGVELAHYVDLEQAISLENLTQRVTDATQREPQIIQASHKQIKRIGWCTGAAQDFIDEAASLGLDAYISGEISERTTHSASENNIHYFAAGHHATERFGVKALGQYLAETFELEHEFVDVPNPV